MTKSKYKNSMRMFWTKEWKGDKTPDEWVECISDKGSPNHSIKMFRVKHRTILLNALDKLVLEKKMSKEQKNSVERMILSPDPENQYIGVSIMATLKPKKFKRNESAKIKN